MKSIRSWLWAIVAAACLSSALAPPLRAAVNAPPAEPAGPRNVLAYASCALAVFATRDIPSMIRSVSLCTALYMSQTE